MELLVQKFLRNGGTLDTLNAQYGIKARRHTRHPELVSLKYSQIESPMGERVVQECRGLILNSEDWSVVARPFNKFFNHGEGHAASLDWNTARVQEKVDGSLMILYFYKDEWQVASSGTPDAFGEVNGHGFTFKDLFWRIWNDMKLALPVETDKTFMFEMCSSYNRVVVRHQTSFLVLIGVRDRNTGLETPVEDYKQVYPVVKSYSLGSLEGILASFATIDPLSQEGFVVVDSKSDRQKMKHPGYVAIHHMAGGMTPKQFLEVVRAGESAEFLVHFPEYAEGYNDVKDRFDGLVAELEEAYVRIQHLESQKDFALEALKTRFSAPLFQRRKSGVTIRKVLSETSIVGLMKTLGLRDVVKEAE